VIVPGGGWAAQPGHMHWAAQSSCLRIYLHCPPGTALKRVEQGETRPMLVATDPAVRMRQLLEAREPFYRLADFVVAADRAPEQVTAGVLELARTHGGW
jgi:shikimate kinase